MFTKIVVGVDGLDGGEDALALANVLAGPEARIVAVNAFPCETHPTRASVGGYEELMRDDTLRMLNRVTEGGKATDLRAIPDVSPARALHHEAERQHADLLVIGSSHRGAIGRVLLGDVSRSTMHGSPCPVVIAPHDYREHPQPIRVIGVGFDAGPEAAAAAEFAAALAMAFDGELRVVTAVPGPTAFMTGYWYSYNYNWPEIAAGRHEQATKELDELLGGFEVAAKGTVVEGSAVERLGELSEDVDLLVTGSRGWGAARRVLLGSTSDGLAHHAHCPVVVVPSPVSEPQQAEESEVAHA